MKPKDQRGEAPSSAGNDGDEVAAHHVAWVNAGRESTQPSADCRPPVRVRFSRHSLQRLGALTTTLSARAGRDVPRAAVLRALVERQLEEPALEPLLALIDADPIRRGHRRTGTED